MHIGDLQIRSFNEAPDKVRRNAWAKIRITNNSPFEVTVDDIGVYGDQGTERSWAFA